MKVSELIERLKNMPQDAELFVSNCGEERRFIPGDMRIRDQVCSADDGEILNGNFVTIATWG